MNSLRPIFKKAFYFKHRLKAFDSREFVKVRFNDFFRKLMKSR